MNYKLQSSSSRRFFFNVLQCKLGVADPDKFSTRNKKSFIQDCFKNRNYLQALRKVRYLVDAVVIRSVDNISLQESKSVYSSASSTLLLRQSENLLVSSKYINLDDDMN